MKGEHKIQKIVFGSVVFGLMIMSGCTTFATLPREKISEADKGILEARGSNAAVHAPLELKTAEDKLDDARVAFNKKDYGKATRLAEQAMVDADYARAKGTTVEVKKKAEELRQNIKTLRQEIDLLSKQITLQGGK
jgi:hypothetical protein